jgi:hypothetical protein
MQIASFGFIFFNSFKNFLNDRQYWGDYPEYFAAISESAEEHERAVAVFRWYISTLYGSFASRKDKDKIEKKPFNPILGKIKKFFF